jgi:hypothetical protein
MDRNVRLNQLLNVLEFGMWQNEMDAAEHIFFLVEIAVEKLKGCKLPDIV